MWEFRSVVVTVPNTILRSMPSIHSLKVWEHTTVDLYTPLPLEYSPTFQPATINAYTIALPYSSAGAAIEVAFTQNGVDINHVTLTRDGVSETLTSGVKTLYLDLFELPHTNMWTISSALDGVYTLTLTRASFNPCLAGETLCFNGGTCAPVMDHANPSALDYNCTCTYGFSGPQCKTNAFSIPVPQGTDQPIAKLSTPTSMTIGACDLLVMSGDKSYGFGSRINSAVFEWKIESITNAAGETFYANVSTPLTPVPPFNLTLGVDLGTFAAGLTSNSVLSIPGYLLADNHTYIFSLTVGDSHYPRASQVRTAVTKLAVNGVLPWLPQVVIHVPNSVTRSTKADFAVAMMPSTCQPLPTDVTYAFQWKVDALTSEDGQLLATPVTAYTSTIRSMSIPAKTLLAGVSYDVSLRVTSTSFAAAGSFVGTIPTRRLLAPTSVSGVTTATTRVTVTRQSLAAVILGGYRQKSVDLAFTIDGSQSNDPDYSGNATLPSVQYEWSASWVPNPNTANSVASVFAFPPSIGVTQARLVLPSNTFLAIVGTGAPVTLTVTLKVRSWTPGDTRLASTTVQVDVIPKPTIPLPIVSIVGAPTYLNPSQSLTLIGSIFSNFTESYLMPCAWSCVSHPSLDLTSSNLIQSKANVSNLILRPNILVPGFYTFQLKVSEPLYINTPNPVFSVAQVTVYVNAPPTGGYCTVTPATGESLVTSFAIACKQWYDPQNLDPLRYSFQYYNLDTDPRLSSPQLIQSAQASSSYSTLLPSGRLLLQVSIIDTAGATAISHLPLNVTLPAGALANPACYVRNMSSSLLASAVGQQDATTAFLLITQLSNVLNTANSSSSSGSCGDDASSGANSTSTSDLRHSLLETLSSVSGNGNATLSPETVQLISQSLASLTSDPSALNNSASWELSQNILKDAIKNFPPPGTADSSSLTDNLASTVSNLLIDCSYLDSVSNLTQSLLSATLTGAVSNSGSNNLNTSNLQASASRGDLGAGAEIVLANGVRIRLTPEALAQYAIASQTRVTPENVDTVDGLASLALDTRIVTFDPRWAQCRNDTSNGVVTSELTTIDITLSNGQVIHIQDLLAPFSFLLPFDITKFGFNRDGTPNATLLASSSAAYKPPVCGENERANLDALAAGLVCGYLNTRTNKWSTDGCRNMGLVNNYTAVNCSCGHTTEFAILYKAELAHAANQCGVDAESSLGSIDYIIFFVLYLVVATMAMIQLSRILLTTKCRHWLMAVEHGLVMSVCLFRAWNMMNFYVLFQYIPLIHVTIISGIPHLFTTWIFTFVIFAWASIYHSSIAGKREENPFKNYQYVFIAINTTVSLALFTIFVLMSQATLKEQGQLNQLGIIIISLVSILFAVFFILYGMLLVRSLTKDFSSPYARKLFFVAVSFSACFFATSAILLLSVVDEQFYIENLTKFNIVYFSLDLIVLMIVMGLFAKSVTDSIAALRQKRLEGSTVGGSRIGSRLGSSVARSTITTLHTSRAGRENQLVELDPTRQHKLKRGTSSFPSTIHGTSVGHGHGRGLGTGTSTGLSSGGASIACAKMVSVHVASSNDEPDLATTRPTFEIDENEHGDEHERDNEHETSKHPHTDDPWTNFDSEAEAEAEADEEESRNNVWSTAPASRNMIDPPLASPLASPRAPVATFLRGKLNSHLPHSKYMPKSPKDATVSVTKDDHIDTTNGASHTHLRWPDGDDPPRVILARPPVLTLPDAMIAPPSSSASSISPSNMFTYNAIKSPKSQPPPPLSTESPTLAMRDSPQLPSLMHYWTDTHHSVGPAQSPTSAMIGSTALTSPPSFASSFFVSPRQDKRTALIGRYAQTRKKGAAANGTGQVHTPIRDETEDEPGKVDDGKKYDSISPSSSPNHRVAAAAAAAQAVLVAREGTPPSGRRTPATRTGSGSGLGTSAEPSIQPARARESSDSEGTESSLASSRDKTPPHLYAIIDPIASVQPSADAATATATASVASKHLLTLQPIALPHMVELTPPQGTSLTIQVLAPTPVHTSFNPGQKSTTASVTMDDQIQTIDLEHMSQQQPTWSPPPISSDVTIHLAPIPSASDPSSQPAIHSLHTAALPPSEDYRKPSSVPRPSSNPSSGSNRRSGGLSSTIPAAVTNSRRRTPQSQNALPSQPPSPYLQIQSTRSANSSPSRRVRRLSNTVTVLGPAPRSHTRGSSDNMTRDDLTRVILPPVATMPIRAPNGPLPSVIPRRKSFVSHQPLLAQVNYNAFSSVPSSTDVSVVHPRYSSRSGSLVGSTDDSLASDWPPMPPELRTVTSSPSPIGGTSSIATTRPPSFSPQLFSPTSLSSPTSSSPLQSPSSSTSGSGSISASVSSLVARARARTKEASISPLPPRHRPNF